MKNSEHSIDKNKLLSLQLITLAKRGLTRKWADSTTPFYDLEVECALMIDDHSHSQNFKSYLQKNSIIQQSVRTLLSHLAMAANGSWQDVPLPARLIARHGWMIGRWLPTFLIIDGPLGKFLRATDSPLNVVLRTQHKRYPILAQARDLFNHDLFRRVRNGVGHWSFTFEQEDSIEKLLCFDLESGSPTEISISEAEALHLTSFSIIECLDKKIFQGVNPL